MAKIFTRSLCFLLLASSCHSPLTAATPACYYPNGDISTEDVPCTDGMASICCPLNWSCEDTGLCYLANEDYYERHTCSDSSWPSDSCPHICINGATAGNVALLWCDHRTSWCCDGNRSWNCCTTADTTFFDLQNPSAFAFISATPSVMPSSVVGSAVSALPSTSSSRSSLASSESSTSPASSTSSAPAASSTLMASTSSPPSASATTETLSQVTTGNNGEASTVTYVVTSSMASMSMGSGSRSSHSYSHSIPIIVGLAIGIPLVCVLAGLASFLLCRHHRSSKKEDDSGGGPSPIPANYQPILPGSHAPELAGYPVAAKTAKSGRESELYGSETHRSPTMSVGTNRTSLPLYSPGSVEEMPQIQEGPAELWGGYVPYRPPQTHVEAATEHEIGPWAKQDEDSSR